VHSAADAVTDEFADDVVAIFLDEVLDEAGDVGPFAARAHILKRQVERLASDVEKPLQGGVDIVFSLSRSPLPILRNKGPFFSRLIAAALVQAVR
jgi:hypothetical protein